MDHTNTENLAEALRLLEDAAKQKKEELKSVITDKYAHLKSVIVETETGLARSIAEARRHAAEAAALAKEVSVAKATEITQDVDKRVHMNPWPFIAGSAVVGLLLGVILGRNPK